MNKNITLDFTANKAVESATEHQPLAIMPADLAKKLLRDYAKRLVNISAQGVIRPLIDELEGIARKDSNNKYSNIVDEAVSACANFIQERHLIDNCSKENWEVFTVDNTEEIVLNGMIKAELAKPSIDKIVEKSLNH